MCEWGNEIIIHVIRRNHPAVSDGWHSMPVDSCIAAYVQVMNDLGIITLGCCCGHGKLSAQVLVASESKELMKTHNYDYYEENKYTLFHHIESDEDANTYLRRHGFDPNAMVARMQARIKLLLEEAQVRYKENEQ